MKPGFLTFFKINYPKIFSVVLFIFLLGAYMKIFAIGSPYNAGDTLNPACAPGEVNCYVAISGGSSLIGSTSSLADETWLGTSTTNMGTASTFHTIFIGINAGRNATNATTSNFVGYLAGDGATNAFHSNFFGGDSGEGATNATKSNFFGQNAGYHALNANASNFFGENAGFQASAASSAVFIGGFAGYNATNARNTIFIGINAGHTDSVNNLGDVNDFSILIGKDTSTNGNSNSIAIGGSARNTASNQLMIGSSTRPINQVVINGSSPYLNFSGTAGSSGFGIRSNAGVIEYKNSGGSWTRPLLGSTSSVVAFSTETWLGAESSSFGTASTDHTVLIGINAGFDATNAANSIFIGNAAGSGATNGNNGIYLGQNAGQTAVNAGSSIFLGTNAGINGTNASFSIFLGPSAGGNAPNASNSQFIGQSAGFGATSASRSTFIGKSAGGNATDVSFSNFIGDAAGFSASNATNANFIGTNAGKSASNATGANFIGQNSGNNAIGASNSTFIGVSAGQNASFAANSIFIGTNAGGVSNFVDNTSDPDDYSILIGNNTSTGDFSNSIALGANAENTDTNQFMIGSTTRRIETLVFNGGIGNTCSIVAGTGITCSSDERLKTNIIDLGSNTLDKILSLRTVTYNWNSNPNGKTMMGFIAQNLQVSFPELVSENKDGMLSVNYAQITPAIVEALREMNLKVVGISDMTKENTFRDSLIAWLSNATNHITRIFTGEVCLADTDGTSECINKTELHQLKQLLGNQTPPPDPTPIPDPTPDPLPPADPHLDQIPNPDTTSPSSQNPQTSTDQPQPSVENPTESN